MPGEYLKGFPDPPNSPNEKFLLPKTPQLWQDDLYNDLINNGAPHELALAISRSIAQHEDRKALTEQHAQKQLEWWANIHTHPGGIQSAPGEDWDSLVYSYGVVGIEPSYTKVYSPEGEYERNIPMDGGNNPRGAMWSPSMTQLAVGHGRLSSGTRLTVVNEEYARITAYDSVDPLGGYINDVSWSPDERYLALALGANGVWVIDTNPDPFESELFQYGLNQTYNARFSHDGTMLALAHDGGNRGTVITYPARSTVLSLSDVSGGGSWYAVAWSPDDTLVAFGTTVGRKLHVRDIATNTEQEWYSPTQNIRSVAWSPDGSLLAVGLSEEPYFLMINTSTGDAIDGVYPAMPSTVNGVRWLANSQILGIAHDHGHTFINREGQILPNLSDDEETKRHDIAIRLKPEVL